MNKKRRIKDRSTISPVVCIIEHLYWMVLFFINYKMLFFISLNNCTVGKSILVLVFCMIITSIVGCAIRWRRCMTTRSVLADIMIGIGIYTILAYHPYYKRWFMGLVISFFVLFLFYIIYVFSRKVRGETVFQIRNKDRKAFIIKSRFIRTLDTAGLYMGAMMAIMIVPIGYNRIFNHGIITADSDYSTTGFDINYSENELSLAYNLDTIEKIRENARWKPLSIEEKIKVLQAVCDCEMNYFGLDNHITVVISDLKEETHGEYNDLEKTVIINRKHLEEGDAHEVLETCLHEMYHAYECSLVRLYLDSTKSQRKLRVFMHCEEYINEMNDYKESGDSHESFMEYYCQYMEKDSRHYADYAVFDYYQEIDELQGNYEKYYGLILDYDYGEEIDI